MATGTNFRYLKYLKHKRKAIKVFLRIIFLFFLKKIKIYNKFISYYLRPIVKEISNRNYDIVIAFQEGFPTFLSSKVTANSKIAWIHSNYEEYLKLCGVDEKKIYISFNHIVCVSAFTMKAFLKIFPQYYEKTHFIYNLLDVNFIKTQSIKEIDDFRFDTSLFTIISIGRLDPVKQFSKLPYIAYKLKQRKQKFKWYLLGDGNPTELKIILDNIMAFNVEDCFIYLGSKFNPYPYIAQSDLLISSSISEACPYVVNEAKVLGVPIVTTNYGSSYEFINHKVNGYITTLDEMDSIIDHLIMNQDTYNQIRANLKEFVYDNESIVKQIVEII
jgi:glycosyltransferase involved in cell wall biosynthesis